MALKAGDITFNMAYNDIVHVAALPATGVIGLAIVAVACVVAGAFIILRRG